MKRVLVIGMSSNLGGVECFIMNYFRNIDKRIVALDFLIFGEQCVFEDEILSYGAKIYKILPSRFRQYFAFKKSMYAFFQNDGKYYDAVWMNDCSLINVGDLNIARKFGVKCRIFHSHNSQHMRRDSKRFFYEFMHTVNRLRVGTAATNYWACSEGAGKFCFNSKLRNSYNYSVIPNAIDVKKFSYNEDIRYKYRKELGVENKYVVGTVGRLHFQKNQLFLLDIFKEILKLEPNAVLWIVGEGEDRDKIEAKIKCLDLEKNTMLFGLRDDIPQLLQAMDCFVLPSLFEGLGIVLVEAQAAGLCTFASKDVIPKCVKATDLLTFISLTDKPSKWAELIVANRTGERIINVKKLYDSYYNIVYSAKEMEQFFESI